MLDDTTARSVEAVRMRRCGKSDVYLPTADEIAEAARAIREGRTRFGAAGTTPKSDDDDDDDFCHRHEPNLPAVASSKAVRKYPSKPPLFPLLN